MRRGGAIGGGAAGGGAWMPGPMGLRGAGRPGRRRETLPRRGVRRLSSSTWRGPAGGRSGLDTRGLRVPGSSQGKQSAAAK